MTALPTISIAFDETADPQGRLQCLCEAFQHVIDQTTIPDNWRIGLLLLWLRSQLQDRGTNDFIALMSLTELDWDWPAFDQTRRTFNENDMWPSPWHHYRKVAADVRRPMRTERVKLLVTTLRTAVASREAYESDRLARMKQFGWSVYCQSDVAHGYVMTLSQKMDIDDWRTWPPFFPGDVSSVQSHG